MPNEPIDGRERIPLNKQLTLIPTNTLRGTVGTPEPPERPAVLSGAEMAGPSAPAAPAPTLGLTDFTPAQPPMNMDVVPIPPDSPAVLGAETTFPAAPTVEAIAAGVLEYQPQPGEENMAYALLNEIITPDGIIYDVTLHQSGVMGAVLGPGENFISGMLRFPVNRIVNTPPSPAAAGEVLGDMGDMLVDIAGRGVVKHMLHLVKAPIDRQLQTRISHFEGEPSILPINADAEIGDPLTDAQAWRTRFPPAQEHRVLLIIHGFGSNIEKSLPAGWVRDFVSGYDAILGYQHPTFTRDPLRNAADLLEMIPPDVRLNVDIVAHSRGGLVGRSLVELQPAHDKFTVQRLLTCGSPHAGTTLAHSQRWDRLISIGFTTASWLQTALGASAPFTFLPRGLEFLMRAGSQSMLDLPGIEAMDPTSEFLRHLNAPGDIADRVRYAAITSTFSPSFILQSSFREAMTSLAAQAFHGVPNDLVVPTESMSSIDLPTSPLGEWVLQGEVNHFSYFDHQDIHSFARTFMFG